MSHVSDKDMQGKTAEFLAHHGIKVSDPIFDTMDGDDLRTMISQTFADQENLAGMHSVMAMVGDRAATQHLILAAEQAFAKVRKVLVITIGNLMHEMNK
jgi:hypothetical protein